MKDWEFLTKYFKLSDPLRDMSINQGFGENNVDFYKKMGLKGHNGLDLRASIGDRTFAVIDGTVTYAGEDGTGGRAVKYVTDEIEHEGVRYRLEFIYYHLEKWWVKKGDKITRGEEVGLTGNTGKYTTGPHLHWGIKVQWYDGGWKKDYNNGYRGAVDPLPFLTYKEPEIMNPFNLSEPCLVQLTEGRGGFGLYSKGKLYIDDTDLILSSFLVISGGDIVGKTTGVSQEVWNTYSHYNLKNQPLTK